MGLMSVSNLHAGYGVNEIIHGIDFVADPREIVTILGPNGCGKSTFIRSLLGYVKMTRGTVRFNGSDISSLSPTARMRLGIGYVPQLATCSARSRYAKTSKWAAMACTTARSRR